MASWSEVTAAAPELADAVRGRFEAHKHAVLATLRADGSPRVSGTETSFTSGELWLGGMPGARKSADLKRDPRLALHSATADPELADGDAKVAGHAVEVLDETTRTAVVPEAPAGPFDLFRIDVTEVVLVKVATDHLVIDTWHEGTGLQRVDRY